MAKKKDEENPDLDELEELEEAQESGEEQQPEIVEDGPPAEEDVQPEEASEEPPAYTKHSWKGVKTVYRCSKCERFEDDEGDMQLHYLTHFPQDEREAILNKLLEV